MALLQGLYPRIRYKDGKRRFWNPVYKKTLLPLPEELVRHRFLEYLIEKRCWSLSRISMESGVEMSSGKGRTDLVCYNKSFAPVLLVECKAPNIPITEKTAIQAVQYNRALEAEYLCLTNGQTTRFFKSSDPASEINPDEIFDKQAEIDYDEAFWQERGFVGEKSAEQTRAYISEICSKYFTNGREEVAYLRPPVIFEHSLNHFYKVDENGTELTAWTFMSTPDRKSYLVLLKSSKKELQSVLIWNPDKPEHLILLQPKGIEDITIQDEDSSELNKIEPQLFTNHLKELSKYC